MIYVALAVVCLIVCLWVHQTTKSISNRLWTLTTAQQYRHERLENMLYKLLHKEDEEEVVDPDVVHDVAEAAIMGRDSDDALLFPEGESEEEWTKLK